MQQRDEEGMARPLPQMRPVEISSQVAALVPGSENAILDTWVQIGSTRVTEVAVGQSFTIHCKYTAHNAIPLWKVTVDWVKTTVTVIGEGIKRYEDTILDWDKKTFTVKLDKYQKQTPSAPVMPSGSGSLSLRFKLWLHDSAYIDPPYPPETSW